MSVCNWALWTYCHPRSCPFFEMFNWYSEQFPLSLQPVFSHPFFSITSLHPTSLQLLESHHSMLLSCTRNNKLEYSFYLFSFLFFRHILKSLSISFHLSCIFLSLPGVCRLTGTVTVCFIHNTAFRRVLNFKAGKQTPALSSARLIVHCSLTLVIDQYCQMADVHNTI